MATVTEQVGEVLLGTTEEPQLSHSTRVQFLKFAKKEGEDKAPVSPVGTAPVAKDEAPKSEPVSAVSAEHNKPVTPPKTDGANDLRFDRMEHADPQNHNARHETNHYL